MVSPVPPPSSPVPAVGDVPIEITDYATETVWRFDAEFLGSNWTCVWGRGCKGILDHDAEELGQGCCSVGAELLDDEEAMLISALAPTIDPRRFQFHDEATATGVFAPSSEGSPRRTALVDEACIFLNRPDFEGGAGCALHLQAEADGESPTDWKPSVCWQLPLRVVRRHEPGVGEVAELRRWGRDDWGPGGQDMAWCCTEESAAYIGTEPVVDHIGNELVALVGREVYVELKSKMYGSNASVEHL